MKFFQVSVSLTPCGVEHHNDVAATIYAHIHALSGMSQQQVQTYWEDMSLCDWLDFHYKQKGSSPRDYAAAISNKALITSDPVRDLFHYMYSMSLAVLDCVLFCLHRVMCSQRAIFMIMPCHGKKCHDSCRI